MAERVLSFISLIVRQIFNNTAEKLWDGLWEEIFAAIIAAEEKWEESGQGKVKKEWVMEQVMNYAKEELELNWIKRRIVEFFISRVIDSLIETFNELVGEDWIDQVKELEEEWRERYLNKKLSD
ncbi:hypothetical protein MWH28_05825 [Natroniella sulfidigena]|uniref:hypothetical protein n=1 Tax=Natroniella sulfidigena TaxID=723921 RepID=UPI00200A386B|nr:hypothetical protein [Natroniella sulfidigena]MCK8816891.1 hypothetical protein [Natroniella sulfidigena]